MINNESRDYCTAASTVTVLAWAGTLQDFMSSLYVVLWLLNMVKASFSSPIALIYD